MTRRAVAPMRKMATEDGVRMSILTWSMADAAGVERVKVLLGKKGDAVDRKKRL
jgi:hypothetical protein